MYDGPSCEGNQFTVSMSFDTRAQMNHEFPANFIDDDTGETRTIRSIKHPARSKVTVYTEDNFTGGGWKTENTSDVLDRPDFICSTFRYDNANTTDLDQTGDNLGLDRQMQQRSVLWEYEDCPTPVMDLGDPNGVYFWVVSDKYIDNP